MDVTRLSSSILLSSYWKARRGTALGLSSLISSKLLKKMLMYSWMEEQSPAEKIKIFLEKNYEKYWKLRNRFLDFKFFWGGMPPSLQTALAVRALDDRRSCFVPGSVRTVILCRQGQCGRSLEKRSKELEIKCRFSFQIELFNFLALNKEWLSRRLYFTSGTRIFSHPWFDQQPRGRWCAYLARKVEN